MSNCLAKLIGPLQAEQFRVVNVADREEVVNVARSETPHLVLERYLKTGSGIAFLRKRLL